jgi:hypothetical protein
MNLDTELDQALAEAKRAHEAAEKRLDEVRVQADEVMAKARRKRDELVAGAGAEERQAREEMRRLEKMRKLWNGEPLTTGGPRPPGTAPPEEKVERVLKAARELSSGSNDGFTVNAINSQDGKVNGNIPSMGHGTIVACLDVLRANEVVRRAGKRGTGQVYKLIES